MGWLAIVVAGLLEIAWAHSIRLTHGFTRPLMTVASVLLTALVMYVLNLGMRTVPVGTAYAVFVGIGAVGTAIAGALWLDEPMGWARVLALGLVVGGVVLLRLTDTA